MSMTKEQFSENIDKILENARSLNSFYLGVDHGSFTYDDLDTDEIKEELIKLYDKLSEK